MFEPFLYLNEECNFNITKYLAHIISVFEDFKIVQQIREGIEKIKPNIALTTLENEINK